MQAKETVLREQKEVEMCESNGKGRIGIKRRDWTGLALALLLPVCAAWGANPATPGVQVVSNETYTLTLTANPDQTAICRGKPVTFTASLRCSDPDEAAVSEKVIIDVVKGSGSGSSVTNYGSVSISVTGVEQGEGNIAVTAKSGDGKLSISRSIDVINVAIESGATSCVHKANPQLKIDTTQSYSPDDGYGWFVEPDEGLCTTTVTGETFTYYPTNSAPGIYTVTAKSVTLPACQDSCTVHVVKVDLAVAGVASTNKGVAPGGLVCVTNGPSQTATRTELTINKCEPADWDGSVELLWTAGNVKVYNAATGGDEVTSGVTFANVALPTSLWVEGTAPSATAGDIVFRLNPIGIECPNVAEGCDKVVMTVVKVESIEPDAMENLEEISDGDNDPRTRIFIVPIAGHLELFPDPVTVRANIIPNLSDSELPDGWSLQGGIGSRKLTRTVSRISQSGASKTEFTFTCGGSDSGFKTTVYVYDAKVGLFADEGDLQNLDVGHSWGRFSLDPYARELIPWNLGLYLQEIGFWPSINGSGNCAGQVRLGGDAVGYHVPTGWKEYPIMFNALSLALPQVKASYDNPPWYNLFNYNCTDYAIGIGEAVGVYTMDAAGVSTPWVFSAWLISH